MAAVSTNHHLLMLMLVSMATTLLLMTPAATNADASAANTRCFPRNGGFICDDGSSNDASSEELNLLAEVLSEGSDDSDADDDNAFARTLRLPEGHKFMRFGREPEHKFMRFGRDPEHKFMRFGRAKSTQQQQSSAPNPRSFMRNQREPQHNFMRFGRSAAAGSSDGDNSDARKRLGEPEHKFMRFGREPEHKFMRFGREPEHKFMRFGREPEHKFMRFGRGFDELLTSSQEAGAQEAPEQETSFKKEKKSVVA